MTRPGLRFLLATKRWPTSSVSSRLTNVHGRHYDRTHAHLRYMHRSSHSHPPFHHRQALSLSFQMSLNHSFHSTSKSVSRPHHPLNRPSPFLCAPGALSAPQLHFHSLRSPIPRRSCGRVLSMRVEQRRWQRLGRRKVRGKKLPNDIGKWTQDQMAEDVEDTEDELLEENLPIEHIMEEVASMDFMSNDHEKGKLFFRKGRRGQRFGKKGNRQQQQQVKLKSKDATLGIPAFVGPRDLATYLKTTMKQVHAAGKQMFEWWPQENMKKMQKNGYESLNHTVLSFEESSALAATFGHTAELKQSEHTDLEGGEECIEAKVPVITILGHYNHGKTTLLDALRGGDLAKKEPFGITQDTYNFRVSLMEEGTDAIDLDRATFLDTPGHQNFFNMRANGASFSDLVLLVVAADAGVLPQTQESLEVAQELGVGIVVAINKCDAPEANVERVREQLRSLGLSLLGPEEDFPEVQGEERHAYVVEVSALKGHNISLLRQTLRKACQAKKCETDLNSPACGAVLEAIKEEGGRGFVVRIVLWSGLLRPGDTFVCGLVHAKVRALRDAETGEDLVVARAGVAVEVMGCPALPEVGDDFFVASPNGAKEIAQCRIMEFQYAFQDRLLVDQAGNLLPAPDGDISDWDDDVDSPPTLYSSLTAVQDSVDSSVHLQQNSVLSAVESPASEEGVQAEIAQSDNERDVDQEEENEGPGLEAVIRTDNSGTLRMLLDSLYRFNKMHRKEVLVVASASVGRVIIRDVYLAAATPHKTIHCLRTRPLNHQVRKLAKQLGVTIHEFPAFHLLLDDLFRPFYQAPTEEEGPPAQEESK